MNRPEKYQPIDIPGRPAPLSISDGRDSYRFDIREAISVLRAQLPTVLLVTAVAFALAAAFIYARERTYSAAALIEIDPTLKSNGALGSEQKTLSNLAFNSAIETEVEILGSPDVAIQVIRQAKLWTSKEYLSSEPIVARLMKLFSVSEGDGSAQVKGNFEELSGPEVDAILKALSRQVSFSRRGLTNIVEIKVKSPDAETAATVANAYAKTYLEAETKSRLQEVEQLSAFLQDRLDALADDIGKGEFDVSRVILENASQFGAGELKQALGAYRSQLDALGSEQNLLKQTEETLRIALARGTLEDTSGLAIAPDLKSAIDLKKELTQQLESGNKSVETELNKVLESIRNIAKTELDKNQARVADLLKDQANIRKSIGGLVSPESIPADLAVALFRIQKKTANSQKLYETYAGQLEELRQTAGMPTSAIRLVSSAYPAVSADPPSRVMMLSAAGLLAAFLGVVSGLVRQYYVGGIGSVAQLEEIGGHQVLGTVLDAGRGNINLDLASHEPVTESVLRLRISVDGALLSASGKKILLTSTQAQEGKSTVALALARAFASSGQPTILLECDLRRPSIAKTLKLKVRTDLVDAVLSKDETVELSKYVWRDAESGLDILFAGDRGPIATDLIFESEKFAHLVKMAEQNYTYVIIDSPPVGAVADAQILQRLCNVVLYIVSRGSTNQRDIVAGVRHLDRSQDAAPLFFVLNRTTDMLTGYGAKGSSYGY